MRRSKQWSLLVCLALGACGPREADTSITPEPTLARPPSPAAQSAAPSSLTVVDPLVSLMRGSFSSREQALGDPEFFDIRLHMMPIWTDRDDARWLYVEQAVAVAQAEPYRQRVYRVAPGDDGTIVSAVYTIEDPQRVALAWKDPGKLEALREDELLHKDGCEVVLRQTGPERFEGATGERSCHSDLRGASYATSEVTVTPEGVLSWDRGFDDAGQQVWGATKGGYRFLHDDPQAPPVPPPAKTGE